MLKMNAGLKAIRNAVTLGVAALSLAVPAIGEAQQIQIGRHNAQTFYFAEDVGKFVTVYDSKTLPQFGVVAGLGFHYTDDLLVVREFTLQKRGVLGEVLTGDLFAAFGITDWLQFNAQIPYHFIAEYSRPDVESFKTSNYLGDMRFSVKGNILDRNEYPVGLAAVAYIAPPTGNEDRYLGNVGEEYGAKVVVDADFDVLYVAANLGYNLKPKVPTPEYTIDDQFTYGVGVNLALTNHFELIGDLYGSTVVNQFFEGTSGNPVEGTIAARGYFDSGYILQAGVGRGLTSGLGAPPWRVHALISFQAPASTLDRDGDGIPDHRDRCPAQPEDFDGFEDDDGCPDDDHDGDGIPNSVDMCPDQPEDFDGFEDEDGCPDVDNDGDGIFDEDDQCPLEPETFNGFQDDDGCPDVLESTVRGKVTAGGNAVNGTVRVNPGDITVPVTEGAYSVTVPEPGIYTFVFEAAGHSPVEKRYRIGAGQTLDLNVQLEK